MTFKNKGKHVFYHAIESIWFDKEASEIVVKTISGEEHRCKKDSEDHANRMIEGLIEAAAMCS